MPVRQYPITGKRPGVKYAPEKLPAEAEKQLEYYWSIYNQTGSFQANRGELRDGFFRKYRICTVNDRAHKKQIEEKLREYIAFYILGKGQLPEANIPPKSTP